MDLLYFTLFDAEGIVAGESGATAGVFVLLIGSVALLISGVAVFCKRDLHI
ncbi:MAG: hypothetical protein J6K26_09670 [Lachnospiraceae bacterium]|nr:hypothetical protein [Lachnospiraceae bacterium]